MVNSIVVYVKTHEAFIEFWLYVLWFKAKVIWTNMTASEISQTEKFSNSNLFKTILYQNNVIRFASPPCFETSIPTS